MDPFQYAFRGGRALSILKLQPACKDYLWGGNRLIREYNKVFDGERLAETWELSCHPDGPSLICEGDAKGRTLPDYITRHDREVLGSNCAVFQDFPILIKLIDAKNDLSIQVHPNNLYALSHEGQYGKSEMWYVLEAEPDAFIYYGFQHPITREEYKQRIENHTLTEVLNARPVQRGDCIFIPAGTVHAICKGVVIAEIQQNSNVTYRVYDYGRKDKNGQERPLHIEKAVEVSCLEPPKALPSCGDHLLRCMYFTVDLITESRRIPVTDESFLSLLVIDGEGTVTNGSQTVPCKKGDSLFLPADSGECEISGGLTALCTQIGTI